MGLGLQGRAFRIAADALGGGSLAEDQARRVLMALREAGFVCAPIEPDERMLDAAWSSALAEDAAGVWDSMIAVMESDCYAVLKERPE